MPESTHDLLLALAGRVDDDLLAWARELVAIGEDGQAVDLLTAALIADRVALPAAVRAALVHAGRLSRAGLDADRALPADAAGGDVSEHRFGGDAPDPAAARRLAAALPAERLHGCRVLLAWRLTPAGAAPGPLPQPVVLVESDGSAGLREVLAHQVAAALERARTPAAVEVLDAGAPLPAYHAAALDVARPIGLGRAAEEGRTAPHAPSWDGARRAAADDAGPRWASTDEHTARRAAPDAPAASEPAGAPVRDGETAESAEAVGRPPSGERPGAHRPPARAAAAEVDHTGGHAPAERTGAHGPAASVARADRAADHAGRDDRRDHAPAHPDLPSTRSDTAARARPRAEPPTSPGLRPAGRPGADGPDPLSGPLRQPLLEPLLDPTIRPDDPLGLGTAPLAPAQSAAPADDDWFSGSWAVPADRPTTPASAPPTEAPDGPLPRRRRAAEQDADPAPATPPAGIAAQADPQADTPSPDAPSPRPARRNRYRPDHEAASPPERPAPDPGPRAESLAALSDTERELLAQLQAELAAREGRPRVSRRAGIAGAPSTNGNGNGSPRRPRPDPTD